MGIYIELQFLNTLHITALRIGVVPREMG